MQVYALVVVADLRKGSYALGCIKVSVGHFKAFYFGPAYLALNSFYFIAVHIFSP
jgi:hypothetical protein